MCRSFFTVCLSLNSCFLLLFCSITFDSFFLSLIFLFFTQNSNFFFHTHTVKPGKGAAFVRAKLKNVITGNVLEKTFRAGEKVESAQMEKATMQFTYMDGEQYVFMDMETYEETRLERDDSWAKFLKEGMEAGVLEWQGKVIGVELPRTVTLEVTQSDPGVKGNTKSGGGDKPATLETGHIITVPLFIEEGEMVLVDTVTGEYAGREK